MVEQKVYVRTAGSYLYPNLYVFIVGDAGTGKSKAINAAEDFVRKLQDITISPTSMTMASLVDHLAEAKKTSIIRAGEHRDYNSMYIMSDELSAFMSEYSNDLIAGLTKFFDCTPYSQARRTKDIHVQIKNPQLNILSGSTPSNLLRFIPEFAWEQGFTSRIILIFSAERPIIDIFKNPEKPMPPDMVSDLTRIASLRGQIGWDDDYPVLMWKWKQMGLPPVPDHPKLEHYNSRRFSHALKLAMVANIDRGDTLHLTREDFNKAMEWLIEAESLMPKVFSSGKGGADNKAIDEIMHFVSKFPNGIHQTLIVNYARNHIEYASSIGPVLDIMQQSGLIRAVSEDEFGLKTFKPLPRHQANNQ